MSERLRTTWREHPTANTTRPLPQWAWGRLASMRQIPGGLGDRAPSSCPPENPGSGIPLPVGTNRPIGHTPLRRRDLARYDAFGERWGAGPSDLASVEPELHDSGRSSCPSITPPRQAQQGRDLPASTIPRRVLCAGEAQALLAESLRPRSPRRNSCSAPPAAPGHLSPRMRPLAGRDLPASPPMGSFAVKRWQTGLSGECIVRMDQQDPHACLPRRRASHALPAAGSRDGGPRYPSSLAWHSTITRRHHALVTPYGTSR